MAGTPLRFARGLAAGLWLLAAASVSRSADPPTPHPLLGKGFGIDHVVIAVPDLEAARTLYRDRLGFKLAPAGAVGRHPSGTINTSTYFADQSYLELLAIGDRDLVLRHQPDTARFLERHTGALAAALSTSSAADTATRLRVLGFAPKGPQAGTVLRAGDAQPAAPKWLTVDLGPEPPVPLFFIQDLKLDYSDIFLNWDEGFAQARTAPYFRQPNTAVGVSSLWVAVADLAGASRHLEALFGAARRDYTSALLGATGLEFKVLRQSIHLLAPTDAAGPVGRFIADRGAGIMGIGVAVQTLDVVAALLQQAPGQGLAGGRSIVVPGHAAAGLWIEFHEAAPQPASAR